MNIKVLLFSLFRDLAGGAEQFVIELPGERAAVSEALALIFEQHPDLESWRDKMLIAVNCEYAKPETELQSGDELALMPPVQGG